MGFDDIAFNILSESINSVVCIDDEFAESYQVDGGKDINTPRKLKEALRTDTKAILDVYNFCDFASYEENKEYILSQKDLIILDWELDDKSDPKYESSLKILENICFEEKIKFVVIYTHADTLIVKNNLYSFFSAKPLIRKDDIIAFLDECIDMKEFDELESSDYFFGELSDCLNGFIWTNKPQRKEIKSKVLELLKQKFNGNKEKFGKCCKEINEKLKQYKVSLDDLYFIIDCIRNELVQNDSKKIPCPIQPFNNNNSFLLGKTAIVVMEKKETTPAEITQRLSEAMHMAPNNFASLLTIDIINAINKEIRHVNSMISSIDEQAFFYHLKNLQNGENSYSNFYDFMLRSCTYDLYQHCLNHKSELISHIDEYIKVKKLVDIKPDNYICEHLGKLAASLSCSVIRNRVDLSLRFGDVFMKRDENNNTFFLCITSHCDCANPGTKISHNFQFIKGDRCKLSDSLQKAEQENYSFVFMNKKPVPIKWSCKPFTLHIPENNINCIQTTYSGKSIEFEYVTLLKENYTQRIANHSFHHANRVGIDLPHLFANPA